MTFSRRSGPAAWAAAVAVALTLSGCGGDSDGAAPRATPTKTGAAPTHSSSGAAPAAEGPGPNCEQLGLDAAEVAKVTGLALTTFEFANGSCGYTSTLNGATQTVPETASISPGQGTSGHLTSKAAAESMSKAGLTCTNFQGTMYSCWRPPGAVCLANDKRGRLWQTVTGNPFSLTDASIRSKVTSGCESLIGRVIERANSL